MFWPDSNPTVLTPPVENPALAGPNPPKTADIEPQKPLANPPETIKAVYATSWSAGSAKKINYLINLIKETDLNAIVIDIKAFDGVIAYERIPKINSLIKRLHDENIYVIARITVFQDPILAQNRPELAVKSKNGGLWLDRNKLAWIDPAAQEAWDYNIAIAKEAARRGFDEINFDYIRFPSDGEIEDMVFPFYNATTTLKRTVIQNFFRYLRAQLADVRISADVFGQTTVNYDDMGIGQVIEDAYENFDYVAPMIYPSHYISGFIGYPNPAEHPYEIVKYSMDSAIGRLKDPSTKLRPWLQAFDLGAIYTPEMVQRQIKAVYEAATATPAVINGYMLWNPSNVYSEESIL